MTLYGGVMIVLGILGLINGWLLFIATRMGLRIGAIESKIAEHREDSLQNRIEQEKRYVTRAELDTKLEQILGRFDKLEQRIEDRILNK